MTLYVHDGRSNKYKPLSTDKIKKLRRVQEVNEVHDAVRALGPTVRALAAWLEQMGKRGNKMTASDLVVCRVPNCKRIVALVDWLDYAAEEAKKA